VGLLLLAGGFIFMFMTARAGRRSDLAFLPVLANSGTISIIQPAGIRTWVEAPALALDQRQNYPGPTGFCRDGACWYFADAAVPPRKPLIGYSRTDWDGRCRLHVRLPGTTGLP